MRFDGPDSPKTAEELSSVNRPTIKALPLSNEDGDERTGLRITMATTREMVGYGHDHKPE
jgi:hypothetical protein